jgi:hypothetical protein
VAGVAATAKSENDKVSFALDIDGHPATFAGQVNAEKNRVAGTFTQDGKSRPLTLTKQSSAAN